MVGPVTGISLPQLSYTTGTVGITASAHKQQLKNRQQEV